jgi:hypothetical protein
VPKIEEMKKTGDRRKTGIMEGWNSGETRRGTMDSRYLMLDKSVKRS